MSENFPILIVLLTLSASLLCPLFSYLYRDLGRWIVTLAIAGALCCSIGCLQQTLASGEAIHYWMGNWAPPLGIEFVIDPLNATIAIVANFVALMGAIYGAPFFKKSSWLEMGGYYTLYGLLATGLSGMIITGDVFNLYVFLEIASLSCYGLIAMGGKRSVLASFRYLLIGTIGASFYLLGVGYLYAITGTLNMADMAVRIVPLIDSPSFKIVIGLFIVGFGIKMALFPLHGWQPDSYTYAHPAAASLIAGVMGKVPIYACIRFFYFIFAASGVAIATGLQIMGIMACCGIILGSVMAIAQKDFRRMLAYSSVAQIGYLIVGMALGNVYGLIGAVLHLINHAFMKGSLFLFIGGVQYRYGEVNIDKFGQLYRKMPIACWMFVIAALSMVGLPPTAGFFSKWYLVLGSMEAGPVGYFYIAIIIISSLLNAIYFFRVIEKIFINPDAGLKEVNPQKGKLELPWQMLLPIIIMGIGILVLGLSNATIVSDVLQFAMPEVLIK